MKRILISSSKGGVGKTTITVETAKKLRDKGVKVGILDADIVAPNVPILLGFDEKNRPKMEYVNDRIVPVEKDGIKVVSYWFDLEEGIPVMINGLKRTKIILKAFCKEVSWGDIDVLLVDCPPTTADEIVTLADNLGHIEGAIIVVQGNTRLSVHDAKLSKAAFEHLNIKILGVVQNMCSEYFNEGIDIEKELGLKIIAKVPLGDLSKVEEVANFILEVINWKS